MIKAGESFKVEDFMPRITADIKLSILHLVDLKAYGI